ncbi:uncharacterized protein SPPG_08158 [Spizellomyces punctatus DAOM BR117]|uniref:Uncharacterized protein n=1 Tax=Spizellomyces punctatus (strain DAOM BR117) TaxID=645134 RepID=A0A0L0H6S8_SPIPD|nr:uncharacterized protein SPPG_08158 [Spizellomyces punctatus DAOM BR117]KNC96571.1 hypothetical protein SPPG_08158 [Spizellomyces punctatus DAOM BR117]|eukprot:XP_016604611.1 hypothetical protein SPPG_08158 [Spizellomyces punctatus DAOM BR117]
MKVAKLGNTSGAPCIAIQLGAKLKQGEHEDCHRNGNNVVSRPSNLESTHASYNLHACHIQNKTDEEWDRSEYTLYIGFDVGHGFFDDPTILPKIDEFLKSLVVDKPLKFKYIRLPYSYGWVTYIWNALFALAIRDGTDFFFQVNDDLALKGTKWSTYFVDALEKNNGFGVAGPWDPRHNGRLLTQAFAG